MSRELRTAHIRRGKVFGLIFLYLLLQYLGLQTSDTGLYEYAGEMARCRTPVRALACRGAYMPMRCLLTLTTN